MLLNMDSNLMLRMGRLYGRRVSNFVFLNTKIQQLKFQIENSVQRSKQVTIEKTNLATLSHRF